MDALPFDPVDLVACNPVRNVFRRWSVVATHDLFGHVLVETTWGRIGAGGQRLTRSFTDENAARRYVGALLARRRSAMRRIGAGYTARTTPRGDNGWRDTGTLAVARQEHRLWLNRSKRGCI